jgi:hypothetical protein
MWTRAALLDAGERSREGDAYASLHLTVGGSNRQVIRVVALPVGRRAAEYGRSMLTRGTDGVRPSNLPGPQVLTVTVPNWVAEVMWWAGKERHDGRPPIPGPMDLPAWVDESGAVTVGVDALTEELAPLRDEAVWLWKRTESLLAPARAAVGAPGFLARFGGSVLKEWKSAIGEVVADMKSARPAGDRPGGEVEGVGYETWIQVKALLARDEVHPDHVELFAHFRGIPWQRWAAVDAAWTQRAPKEWADYDFLRFKPTGAVWEAGY